MKLKETKERKREWQTVIDTVEIHFKNMKKTILWLNTENPALGNLSPKGMIKIGRFDKLQKFIDIAIHENGNELKPKRR